MGEAKRRKQLLGQSYSSPQKIGVYINKSYLTNKHMIWIGVRQASDLKTYPLTAHYQIEDAWYGKAQVEQALKVFQRQNLRMDLNDSKIRQSFLLFLNEHFDYPDDSQVILYNRSSNALTCLEGQERSEWYVEPLSQEENPLDNKNHFGSPEDFCFFIVKKSQEEVYTQKNNVCLFSSYVTAAYIADRLNQNPSPIEEAEYRQIWQKSQLLQGKI
jgi:hypothetical protein